MQGSAERCETQLAYLTCCVDHPYLPQALIYLSEMRENYICTLSAEELFLSPQWHCHSVLRHTDSHHIIIIFILDFISVLLLNLRKSFSIP
jgi:hypothetical protein